MSKLNGKENDQISRPEYENKVNEDTRNKVVVVEDMLV